jgi:hypothetical protein
MIFRALPNASLFVFPFVCSDDRFMLTKPTHILLLVNRALM